MQFDMFYTVLSVVDGDGFVAANIISNEVKEFRLYGIDAPEIKFCRKLKDDEKQTHMPGSLLVELGKMSASFLRSLIPVGEKIAIVQEANKIDFYGRNLCYGYLTDGKCINVLMVANGYAKAFDKYYCKQLPDYQILNTLAKQNRKGLYSIVSLF